MEEVDKKEKVSRNRKGALKNKLLHPNTLLKISDYNLYACISESFVGARSSSLGLPRSQATMREPVVKYTQPLVGL